MHFSWGLWPLRKDSHFLLANKDSTCLSSFSHYQITSGITSLGWELNQATRRAVSSPARLWVQFRVGYKPKRPRRSFKQLFTCSHHHSQFQYISVERKPTESGLPALSPNKSASTSTANGMYISCIFGVVSREAAIYFLICEATVVSANPFNGDVAFVWYSEYMDIEWYRLPAYRPTLHYTKLHYITVQHSIVHGTTSSTFYCISSGCITLSTLHCMHTWVNSHIDRNPLLFFTAGKRQTAAVGCTPCQPGDPMLERSTET